MALRTPIPNAGKRPNRLDGGATGFCLTVARRLVILGLLSTPAAVTAQALPIDMPDREHAPQPPRRADDRTPRPATPVSAPSGALEAESDSADRQRGRLHVPLSASETPDPDGTSPKVLSGSGVVVRDRDGKPALEQAGPGTTVLTSKNAKRIAARSRLSQERTGLPWIVIDVPARDPSEAPVIRSARPFLQLASAVQWEPQSQLHVAEFWVGLAREKGSPGPLNDPLEATLSVSCDSVAPRRITLAEIGPAGDQLITVKCSRKVKNERELQALTLRVAAGQLDYPFELQRRPGAFQLAASDEEIPGFGIGALTLIVDLVEEDGSPLSSQQEVLVPLSSSDGQLEPAGVKVAPGETRATVTVRPSGVGALEIRAGSGLRRSSALTVHRVFPWTFLIATLFGGALGGYLSERRARRRSTDPRRTWRRVVEGSAVGFVIASTMLVFPDLLPTWAGANELAFLLLATLGGFAGAELLDKLTARVFARLSRSAPPSSSSSSRGPHPDTERVVSDET